MHPNGVVARTWTARSAAILLGASCVYLIIEPPQPINSPQLRQHDERGAQQRRPKRKLEQSCSEQDQAHDARKDEQAQRAAIGHRYAVSRLPPELLAINSSGRPCLRANGRKDVRVDDEPS